MNMILPLVLAMLIFSLQAQAQSTESSAREAPVWPTRYEYLEQSAQEPARPVQRGFTIQLGAFREHASAMTTAEALDSTEVYLGQTLRNGETWYLVLWGAYPTQVDAQQAELEFLESHPGLDVWIRAIPAAME